MIQIQLQQTQNVERSSPTSRMSSALSSNSASSWFQDVGNKTKMMPIITKHQATIAVLEREIKNRKYLFGTQLYEAMKLSRNSGEFTRRDSGIINSKKKKIKKNSLSAFTTAEVHAIYRHCESDLTRLMERRTKINSDIIKANKPKALCYDKNSTGSSRSPEETDTISSKSGIGAGVGFFQRGFQFGLEKAREATNITRLKSDLMTIDRQIQQRKEAFGIAMYDTLERLGYIDDDDSIKKQFTADPIIGGLFFSLKEDIAIPLQNLQQAESNLNLALNSAGMVISDEEIRTFIEANPSLWAMLRVTIGLPAEQCQEIAFRVALELISGKSGVGLTKAQVTRSQFKSFQRDYLNDPKGSQEFFHRSVFVSFDADGNGVLDKEEIDKFLDTFYLSGSIFHGDSRLPSKEELKATILEELDENGDGLFDFEEIRSLISGSHALDISDRQSN